MISLPDVSCKVVSIRFAVTFFLIAAAIEVCLSLIWPIFINPEEYAQTMFYIVRTCIVISFLVWLLRKKYIFFITKKFSLQDILIPACIGFAFALLTVLLESAWDLIFPEYKLNIGVGYKHSVIYLPIFLLSCLFIEIQFRGFFLQSLSSKFGLFYAQLITSLIYVLPFVDPLMSPIHFIQSVILCRLFLSAKSFVPPLTFLILERVFYFL